MDHDINIAKRDALVKEHGFLKHLSSIHLSKGNDNQVSIASKSIVKTFISKNFK